MLEDESFKELEVRFRQLDVPPQQSVDGLRAKSERRNALVQLTDRDGRVIADFGDLLDEVLIAAGDPADADAGERVGFAEGAGGYGVGVA